VGTACTPNPSIAASARYLVRTEGVTDEWQTGAKSGVGDQGPKRPRDLRVRKRSGPGSHNQDAANTFCHNKTEPPRFDRFVNREPTDRGRVTATAGGGCPKESICGLRTESLTARFPARKPLDPAEWSGIW